MICNRNATPADALPLTQLYQQCDGAPPDPVMTDVRWLSTQLASPQAAWFVADQGGEPAAMVGFLVDRDHQLAKMTRIYVRAGEPDQTGHALLQDAILRLRETRAGDVIYTTTRSLTPEQQRLTLDLGFRVLGIFPNARGAGDTRLNGLTASFAPGVLSERRHARFALHPSIRPLYEIVRAQCSLSDLPDADPASLPPIPTEPPPPLELIDAPNFVQHRFRQFFRRRHLSVTFYPFVEPNALLTDAPQHVEVFARVMPEMRFATILGERIEDRVNPVALFRAVAELFHRRGISYVEAINDAADVAGIDAILSAGYLPNAYVPCLKNHGGQRRDYVVFGSAIEAPRLPADHPEDVYFDLFRAYYRLHQQLHIPPGARP